MTAIPNATNCGIDFKYRPKSYFFPMGANKFLLATVKGTERRRDVERLIKEGREREVLDWLAHSALDNDTRSLIGSIHPKFMGGEYLPDLDELEVEVARIELASVTSDVFSIRARKYKGRIYYRAVDEYKTIFKLTPSWSKNPLSLKQLIKLIETAADPEYGEHTLGLRFLDESYRLYDFELEECRSFMRVTSAFYPDLEPYYHQTIEAWYQQCRSELEDQDEDQDECSSSLVSLI